MRYETGYNAGLISHGRTYPWTWILPANLVPHWLFQVGAGPHFPCLEWFPIHVLWPGILKIFHNLFIIQYYVWEIKLLVHGVYFIHFEVWRHLGVWTDYYLLISFPVDEYLVASNFVLLQASYYEHSYKRFHVYSSRVKLSLRYLSKCEIAVFQERHTHYLDHILEFRHL